MELGFASASSKGFPPQELPPTAAPFRWPLLQEDGRAWRLGGRERDRASPIVFHEEGTSEMKQHSKFIFPYFVVNIIEVGRRERTQKGDHPEE